MLEPSLIYEGLYQPTFLVLVYFTHYFVFCCRFHQITCSARSATVTMTASMSWTRTTRDTTRAEVETTIGKHSEMRMASSLVWCVITEGPIPQTCTLTNARSTGVAQPRRLASWTRARLSVMCVERNWLPNKSWKIIANLFIKHCAKTSFYLVACCLLHRPLTCLAPYI